MGFFEDELRKLIGAESPISGARYGGRACAGLLGETASVKLQFVTLGTHEKYEGIKAAVFNRSGGEIDSNIFRFADILGKNVTKHNLNNDMPYVWADMNRTYEWYAYKPAAADYAAVAKEINNYLEMFLERERQPVKEKPKILYLLYSHSEWANYQKPRCCLSRLIKKRCTPLLAAKSSPVIWNISERAAEKVLRNIKKRCWRAKIF